MKKLIYFSLALALLAGCGTSATKDNDPWGKVDPSTAPKKSSVFDSSMHSNSMGRDMTYSVYLPADYDQSRTYPFFYLLHGYEDGNQYATHNRCWLDKGNARNIADDYIKNGGVSMVIIMPNGLDKFYTWDGYEDYFEKELMAAVEEKYHGNGKRAIAGLSMGGYGTLYHALRYPEMFTYAYAMSPAADASMASYIDLRQDKSVFPAFTLEVGTNDRTVDNSKTKSLYNSMIKKGLTCEWDEWTLGQTLMGDHDWPFWKACLPKALQKVGASFK